MDAKELGQIIRKRRKELGLKQSDVSLSTGIGLRYISELENGKASSELGKALEIMRVSGLRVQLIEK